MDLEKKRLITITAIICIITLFLGLYKTYIEIKSNESMLITLMLHSVSEQEPENNFNRVVITTKNLENNIEFLKEKGYNFVNEQQVLELFEKQNGSKNIWLTFDDGYTDNYTLLYPILKKHNINALINIVVSYIEDEDTEFGKGYMNWSQINEMQQSGLVDFGSHTYNSHYYETDNKGNEEPVLEIIMENETLDEYMERVKSDLAESWALINLRTGNAPNTIAYPYGKTSKVVQAIARYCGFKIEIGIKNGVNTSQKDLKDIKRINVSNAYTPYELEEIIKYYKGMAHII